MATPLACAVPRTPSRFRPAARGGAVHTSPSAAPCHIGHLAKRPHPSARDTAHATHLEAPADLQHRRDITFLTHGWGPERARAMTAEAAFHRPPPRPPHSPKRPIPTMQHEHAQNPAGPLHSHFFDTRMLHDEARQQPRTLNTSPHIPNGREIGPQAAGDRAPEPSHAMHAPDAPPKPMPAMRPRARARARARDRYTRTPRPTQPIPIHSHIPTHATHTTHPAKAHSLLPTTSTHPLHR